MNCTGYRSIMTWYSSWHKPMIIDYYKDKPDITRQDLWSTMHYIKDS